REVEGAAEGQGSLASGSERRTGVAGWEEPCHPGPMGAQAIPLSPTLQPLCHRTSHKWRVRLLSGRAIARVASDCGVGRSGAKSVRNAARTGAATRSERCLAERRASAGVGGALWELH